MHRNRTWRLDSTEAVLRTQRNRILPIEGGDGSTLTLNFITGVLDPRLTFTRASTGTFINSSGNVATASNNVARFDHDPTTLAPRGLLIEGTATNLLSYSEDFSNAAWTKNGTNGTMPLTGTAPDNNAASRLLEENTTTYAKHILERSISISAGIHTFSVWLKEPSTNSRRYAHIQLADGQATAARYTIVVDVQTGQIVASGANNGTAGAPTGTGHSITPYPGGWYRVTISMNHVASPSYPSIVLGDSASLFGGSNQPFYSATTPYKGLLVWGAQLEAGSGSSYIPTGASTVQRLADFCTIPTSSFITGPLYPQTLFVECIPANPSAAFPDIVRLFDRTAGGTFSYGTELYYYGSSTMTVQRKTNASTNSDRPLASGLAYNSRHKLAVAVDSSAFLGSYDGLTGSGATTAPPALASQVTHMGIGCTGDASAASVMFGTIRQIKFFPFAMAQSQLNTLTTL